MTAFANSTSGVTSSTLVFTPAPATAATSTFTGGFTGTTLNAVNGDTAGFAAKVSGGKTGDGSFLTFGVNTTGYTINALAFAILTSSQGFGQVAGSPNKFEYSFDGGTTFSAPAELPVPGLTFGTQSVDLSSVTALNNNPLAQFRLIFDGAPSAGGGGPTAGTNTLDNLNVTGTALTGTPSAAPEPSQAAGLGSFLVGIAGLAFRARKKAAAAV